MGLTVSKRKFTKLIHACLGGSVWVFSYYRRCKECITIGKNHYRRAYLQMLELKVLGAQLHPKSEIHKRGGSLC